jgi:hypothetical protein
MSTLFALALGALLAASAAAADLVIYRTPEGRLVLSNRPLPSGVELLFRAPDRTQRAQRSKDDGAAGVPSGRLPVPAPHLPPLPQEQASAPRTTPVDTVALTLVTRGMAAADVRGTLGVPERVVLLDPEGRLSSERSSATAGRLECQQGSDSIVDETLQSEALFPCRSRKSDILPITHKNIRNCSGMMLAPMALVPVGSGSPTARRAISRPLCARRLWHSGGDTFSSHTERRQWIP